MSETPTPTPRPYGCENKGCHFQINSDGTRVPFCAWLLFLSDPRFEGENHEEQRLRQICPLAPKNLPTTT